LARAATRNEDATNTPDAMSATSRDRMEFGGWIEAYGRAWETGDDDLMVSLFTEGASYRSAPFREPFRGHDEIRAYARRNAGAQQDTHVRMGRPFIDSRASQSSGGRP
jgi:hypothetical protein